ncbi:xyloglucan endotransglucosylase protein 7-like [Lolium rigidum]|uniref:xyloglucan endotransglucosylase protein 7-like n=1 Tax=Lolium rigidum TaxID=89674 RepID=UPI001F5E2CF7|nr:xyloglucan endotransglucosylase protein 7-like [Lolium rigidum]
MASNGKRTLAVILCSVLLAAGVARGGNFYQDVDITFGDWRAKILGGGDLMTLTMDKASGSGFQSKNQYLFGRWEMKMKLIPGNSAGTVASFYLSSPPQGPHHDEIDFEFLGNLDGKPYTVQTNIFSQGVGGREQQFRMWFDPTKDFHTYTIVWNPINILFYVDGTPIREYRNRQADTGVPFLTQQPMRVYASLWNGEAWATGGGSIKTNWTWAPFVASYKGYTATGCVSSQDPAACASSTGAWMHQQLDTAEQARLWQVQKNYMIANYCTDPWRKYPRPDCKY